MHTFMRSVRLIFALLGAALPMEGGAAQELTAKVAEIRTVSLEPDYYHGWPTAIRRMNGELLLVYSGGREAHVCPFGRVELMRSRDHGASWSWPQVIFDSATDDRDAGILETDKGTIVVTFFTSLDYRKNKHNADFIRKAGLQFGPDGTPEHWAAAELRTTEEEKKADVGMWMILSHDGGVSWSARRPTPCNSPHGPIQLKDGRLFYAGKTLWGDDALAGVWQSQDDGQSWEFLSRIPVREGESNAEYHELHAVEAADGTLIVHIRNHNAKERHLLQTESRDGGKTWNVPHEIGVAGFPSHLLKLKGGRLLMTYGWRKEPFGIRCRVSNDNGKSWTNEMIISREAKSWDLGYPSTVELGDGSLRTLWYESPGEGKKAVLKQASWRME